ncbi:MAG TPA: tetratricopeptide repeat protein [Candidatus Limnocylindrales bacterium]|nr:tetratricopeptide repeat protein [Candidatus Limnocylindrales bacterium]
MTGLVAGQLALARFVRELRGLQEKAGLPSLNQLVAASTDHARPLRRSTISDKLRGRSLPEWDFVVAFVGACKNHAARVGRPLPEDLVDLARWDRAHWEMLRAVDASLLDERLATAARTEIIRRSGEDVAANPVEPAEGNTSDPTTPRQLPPAVRHFAGRDEQLRRLERFLADGPTTGAVRIVAIEGGAGIGKTTLALQWGSRIADRFPDGQLYVNLQGADPSGNVLSAEEASYGFLLAMGIAPERIPAPLTARSALYRSVLADKKVLIVLDNARDAEHVRPLLPGWAGCLVIVTSRSQLTSLVATGGAFSLALDVFSSDEARQMLGRSIGEARLAREQSAVDDIVAHCAGLPLALSIVAARAATRSSFTLSSLSVELRDESRRLDALDGGDSAADVRSVLSWSYRSLPPDAARLFRLLGLHPGPDVDAPAAASLAGVPVAQARRMLLGLSREYLVTEHRPGRFISHDLLRVYAGELVTMHEDLTERQAASDRMFDHYLRAAIAASLLVYPHRRGVASLPPARPDVALVELGDHDQALEWLATQCPVLLRVIQQAVAAGLDSHAQQLAGAVAVFHARHGRWSEMAAVQQIALEAAQRLGDRAGQAHAHRNIGLAVAEMADHGEAGRHYEKALQLFDALGDLTGAAQTHLGLSRAMDRVGRPDRGLVHAKRASDLYKMAADSIGQANALNSVGWCYAQIGDGRQARAACEAALILAQKNNNRWVEGAIWDSLGRAHHLVGDHNSARQAHQHALDICREIGDRPHEADTLIHIGELELAMGNADQARQAWQTALAVRVEINHPDPAEIQAMIDSI